MTKTVVIAGVAGVVSLLALLAWAAIAALGFAWERAPNWLEGGRVAATEVARRVGEVLPGVKETVGQVVPQLTEQAEKLLPGEALPTRDVGGEDIPGVPRFPGLVRTAYAFSAGKRTVTYRGEAEYAAVAAFYQRELAALGFGRTVLSATAREEVHEYRKADRRLSLAVRQHDGRPGGGYAEAVIAEVGP